MKNKLKGFTLVELIVVMALMSILMVAIMNMWKPVRETYVDSTQYEAQRTAQNGVVQYITESVRFAADMGIYTDSSAASAVSDFAAAYCTANNIDSANTTAVTAEIEKYAEVIVIDNKTTHYSKDYTGRLIRRKVDYTTPAAISADFGAGIFTGDSDDGDAVIVDTSKGWRTALSEAYYGENTYQINLIYADSDGNGTVDDGLLELEVYSTRNGKRDISNAGKETAVTANVTRGAVLCRNLTTSHGVANAGIFDVSKYTVASNTPDVITCIVFLTKDGRDQVDAVS